MYAIPQLLVSYNIYFIETFILMSLYLNLALEEADAVLLIGTNPRYEAPLVNTRLRKAYVHNELEIAAIGPKVDLSYKHDHLGDDAGLITRVCTGGHAFSKVLEGAKKPAIIIGADILERPDGSGILATVSAYCKKLNKPVSIFKFCNS